MPKTKKTECKFFSRLWSGFTSFIMGILMVIGKIISALWNFTLWLWEEIITFIQWLVNIIGTIIERFGKFFLWFWGFILATGLTVALIIWLISISVKNFDSTNGAQKFIEKSDNLIEMKVDFIEAMFQYQLKKEKTNMLERCENKIDKEECFKNTETLFKKFVE